MSSFRGLREVIASKGLFCSLHTDRGSHYRNTSNAGGNVDMDSSTQVGRALAQPGIELIPACSLGAKGRSERMFGSLQRCLPQGIQARRHHRYGDRQPVPRGALPASGCRPKPGAALSCPSPGRWRLSSASRRSAPPPTTTRALQGADPADPTTTIASRPGSGSAIAPTAQWPSFMDRDASPPIHPGRRPHRNSTPAGPATSTEAVNSGCSRYRISRSIPRNIDGIDLDPQALAARVTHVNYGDKPLTNSNPGLPLTVKSVCTKLCGERAGKSMRSEIVSRRVKRPAVFCEDRKIARKLQPDIASNGLIAVSR